MTRYQLSLKAAGWLMKANPYAVVTAPAAGHAQQNDGQIQLGRTESIRRSINPDWIHAIFCETNASIQLPIRVEIWNDQSHRSRQDDLLCEAVFQDVYEIYQSAGRCMSVKTDRGTIIHVSVEDSRKGTTYGQADLHFRGLDIKNIEPGLLGLGRSDPFFEIAKKSADHAAGLVQWNVVYRSEYIRNHLNPFWKPFSLDLEELCFADLDWPLKVSVRDKSSSGNHKLIGQFETTLSSLKESVAIKGNADRDRAFEIFKEERAVSQGLFVVLKVDLHVTR